MRISELKNHFSGNKIGKMFRLVEFSSIFLFELLTIIYKHEVDIMSALQQNALTYDDKFEAKDGFFIAAALTRFDSEQEIIEDWRYGELVISRFGWGYDEAIEGARKKLDYHYCSDEELGLVRNNETQIYPTLEGSIDELKLYKKKFKCIPNEQVALWGDYNSAKA